MGNYESLILECLSRIKTLEEKVQILESQINNGKNAPEESLEDQKENKITRSIARQFVMNRLTEENENITTVKANQAEGSGIVIKSKENPEHKLIAKFYYSKSYLDFISSWHTVSDDDIKNEEIALHIFTVSYKQDFYTFFFTKDELRKFISDKKMDNSNLYHFYFQQKNGKFLEVRDDEKDVSKYLNRWKLVSDLMN